MIRSSILIVVAITMVLAACHDHRQEVVRGELALLLAARDEYDAWDVKRQTQLVDDIKAKGGTKEEAKAAVELFRQTVQAVMKNVFSSAFEDVAKAAAGSDDHSLKHSVMVVDEIYKLVHGKKPSEDLGRLPPTLPCKPDEGAGSSSLCP